MRSRLIGTLTGAALLVQSFAFLSLPAAINRAPSAVGRTSPDSAGRTQIDTAARSEISEAYGKLPLSFEQNHGQMDRRVKFLSRGPSHALLLTQTEAVLSLLSEKADSTLKESQTLDRQAQSSVLRMKLVGANQAPQINGRERLQGKSNYLIGNDRGKWRTDIPTYAKVQYGEVYPGIDLVYYGNQRRLEYDFVVAPGADPQDIRLSFDGADKLKIDRDGALQLQLRGGEITQPAPVIYQESGSGVRERVAGHYVLKGDEVAFEIADYDRNRELVIDPQLLYATFYGGADSDTGEDIAVDASGNAYITGGTLSTDLLLSNAYQGSAPSAPDKLDAFVVKLNPSGSDIVYATYLGSTLRAESALAIAITSDGKACVTGFADNNFNASDFPTTSGRFQGNGFGLFNGDRGFDVFVTVLTPGGDNLVYSTFFAGRGEDRAFGIGVDSANKIYITGKTQSNNFPTKNAFQNSIGSNDVNDAFIAKFDPTETGNSSLIYSSYLGGTGGETGNDIAVTPAGIAFFGGVTGSFNFPTRSSSSLAPLQTAQGGVNDGFIAKVSPSGALIYSTYFGGNNLDEVNGVAVDSAERVYVTGETVSSAATFPLKNAFKSNRSGSSEAFVAKLNADGTALFYSSFLGAGGTNAEGHGIAVDGGGSAYVTGLTTTGVFLGINGFPSTVPNGTTFIAKIEASDATGTVVPKILYADSFGGSFAIGEGIAVDPRGNVYIAGRTQPGFTTTPGAFQQTYQGGIQDAFVVKISSTFPDSIGVFRPSTGQFLFRNSNTSGQPEIITTFGQAGDQALAGDWNGDGIDDAGVFRPSTAQFILRQPVRGPFGVIINTTLTINFGLTGDIAVAGDWDGDGVDTPGVFRNGQWLLVNGTNINNSTPAPSLIFNFGAAGQTPVAGDWNGDGIDTIGTFIQGSWALRNSNNAGPADITALSGSAPGNQPIVGDWNGDGVDTIGVLVPSNVFGATTFALLNLNATSNGFDILAEFGADGDQPVSGDWDGKPGNTPPNSGVNNPADGSSRTAQTQVFTTTCSDPDGWHDLSTIDFKITRSDGNGQGVPIALWAQFDENRNLIRLYDPDLQTWSEGAPGSNLVLENGYVQLKLMGTSVQGSGPLGPSVQVRWELVFKNPATGKNYKQYLKITDDAGASTGFDHVGSWSVLR